VDKLNHTREVINLISQKTDRVNSFCGKSETWVDAFGFEGVYQVSNFGRIRSVSRIVIKTNGHRLPVKGNILNPSVSRNGYLVISRNTFKSVGERVTIKIHRLIFESFNEQIKEGLEIDHIDRDKTNNHIDNLRLVNRRDNINNRSNNKKYIGVTDIGTGFSAKIYYQGKTYQLGVARSENEASEYYQKAKSEIEKGTFLEYHKSLNYRVKKVDTPKYISYRQNRKTFRVKVKSKHVAECKTLELAKQALDKYLKNNS